MKSCHLPGKKVTWIVVAWPRAQTGLSSCMTSGPLALNPHRRPVWAARQARKQGGGGAASNSFRRERERELGSAETGTKPAQKQVAKKAETKSVQFFSCRVSQAHVPTTGFPSE